MRPRIGITSSNRGASGENGHYESSVAYARAIAEAGGLPFILPQEPALAAAYVEACEGILFTGGGDPAMEPFGVATDSRARVLDPRRQAFELALLDALAARPDRPVLGICLGMQLMALHAGGQLEQYLPDVLATAADHQEDRRHPLVLSAVEGSVLTKLPDAADAMLVISSHRQSVRSPGRLRVLARALDGVIEAVDDPTRSFYLGVQWHPERGGQAGLSNGLVSAFVHACRGSR